MDKRDAELRSLEQTLVPEELKIREIVERMDEQVKNLLRSNFELPAI